MGAVTGEDPKADRELLDNILEETDPVKLAATFANLDNQIQAQRKKNAPQEAPTQGGETAPPEAPKELSLTEKVASKAERAGKGLLDWAGINPNYGKGK